MDPTPAGPPTVMSLFVANVLPLLFTALATVGTWALAQLARKLRVDGTTSKMEQAGAWLSDLAGSVLADVLSTLKPELQKAAADGRISQGEMASLINIALGRLKALAGERGLEWARGALGVIDLDSYLRGIVQREAVAMGARAADEIRTVADAARTINK